jgi:Mitochondrial carrier protein
MLNSIVTVPYTAITLAFYDIYRDYLFKQGHLDLYSRYTLIGLASTFSTQLLTYPLDTVRRLLQADSTIVLPNKAYTKAWDCFKRVRKAEGISGLYKGFVVNSVKTPIQTVVQLLSYEYMRRTLEAITKYE